MKVYMIWQREYYCDYGVVYVSLDEEKAEKELERLEDLEDGMVYYLSESNLDEIKKVEWYK